MAGSLVKHLILMASRQLSKQRECWKLRDSRLSSEVDSRVHGQPSNSHDNTYDRIIDDERLEV